MYVPGNDTKKIQKVPTLALDSVILDCEDGVAINKKTDARTNILAVLDSVDFGRTERCVRVNSVQSELADEDLRMICEARQLPATILLPKVECVDHLAWLRSRLQQLCGSRHRFNIIIYMESAESLLNIREVCHAGRQFTDCTLEGVVFGSDDYCANVGAVRSADSSEVLFARQYLLTVAKAYNLQAIDMVYIDIKDVEGLRAQSLEGMRMGYTGKQVIHPAQVPVVQQAFSPSPEKIRWATNLIEAFNQHQQSGKGAFTFEGNMIDRPLLLQAQNIVTAAESLRDSK